MDTIEFTVYGTPQSRGSKTPWVPRRKDGSFVTRKDGRPMIATMDSAKTSTQWMQQVREAAGQAFSGDLITEGVILECRFHFPRPKSHFRTGKYAGLLKDSAPFIHTQKPDLSKVTRSIEDALSSVVWRDDSQIVRYGERHGKYWTTEQARVEIKIVDAASEYLQ